MFRYDRSAIAADHKIRLFTCICAIFWCHKMKLRKVMALAASPSTAIQVAGHRFSLQNAQLIAAVFGRVTTQSTAPDITCVTHRAFQRVPDTTAPRQSVDRRGAISLRDNDDAHLEGNNQVGSRITLPIGSGGHCLRIYFDGARRACYPRAQFGARPCFLDRRRCSCSDRLSQIARIFT